MAKNSLQPRPVGRPRMGGTVYRFLMDPATEQEFNLLRKKTVKNASQLLRELVALGLMRAKNGG